MNRRVQLAEDGLLPAGLTSSCTRLQHLRPAINGADDPRRPQVPYVGSGHEPEVAHLPDVRVLGHTRQIHPATLLVVQSVGRVGGRVGGNLRPCLQRLDVSSPQVGERGIIPIGHASNRSESARSASVVTADNEGGHRRG